MFTQCGYYGNSEITMAASRPLSKSERQQKLRRKAVKFFKTNDVESKLETMLNEMFTAQPSDVYGYMSEYFHSFSHDPAISDVKVYQGMDNRGDKTVEVELFCTINGVSKEVSTWSCSVLQEDNLNCDFVAISASLSELLKTVLIKDQEEVDHRLQEHFSTNTALSQAVSCAAVTGAALLSKIPLHKHISSQEEADHGPPTPLLSMLAFGKHSNAKLRFSEFLLSPCSTQDFNEHVSGLVAVYKSLWKTFSDKHGPSGVPVTSFGAMCPPLDKTDAVLDHLQEACKEVGLQLGDQISIWINVAADNMFDQDKNKYEVSTNQWKTPDDLVNIYSDLVQAHPSIAGLIDPFHGKDSGAWQKLAIKLQDRKCLLISGADLTDKLLSSGQTVEETEQDQQPQPLPSVNCASLNVVNTSTLSDLCHKTKQLRAISSQDPVIVADLSTIRTYSQAKYLIEMVIGLKYDFIKMGAPLELHSTSLSSLLKTI